MNLLIKSATIVDLSSDFHNEVVDILIEKGIISSISKSIKNLDNYREIEFKNLHVSQGWFDSSVSFGEPGYEERETIENGLSTAALSGFTAVALNPSTHPVIDSQSAIQFLKSKADGSPVTLLPIGALTTQSNGKDLAEIYDMNSAGAVAFGDYHRAIENPNVLKLALQYASSQTLLVLSFPQENKIANNGMMNEHHISTHLGLKGLPALSEELQISRDLSLLDYTGGSLHIPTISTANSVELIEKAKNKNLDISCSVAVHNLFFTDDSVLSFDSKYKVLPPLRTDEDRQALIEGVREGIIDMVTSDHYPLDIERKKVDFDQADFGTIGLESFYGALQSIFDTGKCIEILTKGKTRFGHTRYSIKVGQQADLSLFDPSVDYTFSDTNIYSTSNNAIYMGEKLRGKVLGIVAKNQLILS